MARWTAARGGATVTETGKASSFFLEPENPPEWPRYFEGAGFKPLANYYSSVTDRLDYEDPKAGVAEQRLTALGVKLRPLEMNRWEQELREVYRITIACFQGSFLYQPQPEAQFFDECRLLQPFVRPELILFAMHHNRTVGFVFHIPDGLQARRGGLSTPLSSKHSQSSPTEVMRGWAAIWPNRRIGSPADWDIAG